MADTEQMLAAEKSATSILHRELVERITNKFGEHVARIAVLHEPLWRDGRWIPVCMSCRNGSSSRQSALPAFPCATYQALIDSVGF